MPQPVANLTPSFTYADYHRWLADERWELIDGPPFASYDDHPQPPPRVDTPEAPTPC